VNELQVIRNQLTTERNRAVELAAAFGTDSGGPAGGAGAGPGAGADKRDAVRQASVEYLVFVLTRFEERDQMLADLLRGRFAESDATRKALQDALARPGASREALARLEAALGAERGEPANAARASEFAAYFAGPWRMRRDAIDSLQEAHLRVTELRAASFVDADSIVEERTRYARVQSARVQSARGTPAA